MTVFVHGQNSGPVDATVHRLSELSNRCNPFGQITHTPTPLLSNWSRASQEWDAWISSNQLIRHECSGGLSDQM